MTQNKRTRGNGEGSVYLVKSGPNKGRWVAASPPLPDGRRKTKTARTREEANRYLVQMLADLHQGLPVITDRQTVEAFALDWLENVARPSIKHSTYVAYSNAVHRHIAPLVGRVKLADLSPQHVTAFLRDLERGGLSPASVTLVRMVLRRIVGQALEWDIVRQNVVARTRAPRVRRAEVEPFTPDQVQTLLRAARGDRLEALYALAVILGVRQGELLGLRWADVDLDRGTIYIKVTASNARRSQPLTEPKSISARRKLRLPPVLVRRLQEHRERQEQETLRKPPGWNCAGLVFPAPSGALMWSWPLILAYKELLRRAGLPEKRFHDLRHTAASIMILERIPIKLVSEILGHSNVIVTLRIYGHLYDDQREAAIDLLEGRYKDL